MTSFFYVVSIAFHTSIPALRKCMDTSRKESLLTESAATSAPSAAPLRRTWKTCLLSPLWVVQRRENHLARSGEYGGCGRHSKDRSWIVATVERAVRDQALWCCNKTPVLRSPRLLVL